MRQQRQAWRPLFEPIEGRQLPSSGLLIALQDRTPRPSLDRMVQLGSAEPQAATASARVKARQAEAAPTGTNSTASGVYSGNGAANSDANGVSGQPTGPNAAATFPIAPLLGNGTPTKAELARERFVARFQGPMTTLPPRFSDQSKILYFRGLGGSSPKFFLHGDYAMAIVLPAGFDPRNPSASRSVTGFAFLDDKNNNSGGSFGLDLSADPTSFDKQGRPTRLTFTSDPAVYSGIFYLNQSSGTVTIRYGRDGTASAKFEGRLYTLGLTSPFQNIDLYAQHSG